MSFNNDITLVVFLNTYINYNNYTKCFDVLLKML